METAAGGVGGVWQVGVIVETSQAFCKKIVSLVW